MFDDADIDSAVEGAFASKQADIGGDAHIVEEEGSGAGAAEGQGSIGINDGVEAVDEIEVLVEQDAAFEHAEQLAAGVIDRRGGVDDQAAQVDLALIAARIGRGDQGRASRGRENLTVENVIAFTPHVNKKNRETEEFLFVFEILPDRVCSILVTHCGSGPVGRGF